MPVRLRTAVPSSSAAAAALRRPARVLLATCALLVSAAVARALPLQITTTSLASGAAGTSYVDSVRTAAGTDPLAFAILGGALPAGLTLDPASGAIVGTPTLAGTANFIVGATDALGDTASAALGI